MSAPNLLWIHVLALALSCAPSAGPTAPTTLTTNPSSVAAPSASADKPDVEASGSASSKPAGSAAPSGAVKQEEPPAPKQLTLAQFATDAPTAACKALTTCKNEEVSVSVGSALQLVAGFGGLDDPKIVADMKEVGRAMRKDNRQAMNAAECTTVMGAIATTSGFTPAKLQAAVDAKKTEFNAEKGAACLAAISTEAPFCKLEKTVKPDLKLGELEVIMKTYRKDLDTFMKSCNDALVGKVAVGAACEHDFECAGEDGRCKDRKCARK